MSSGRIAVNLAIVSTLAAVLAIVMNPAGPMPTLSTSVAVSLDLYGSASQGWGFTATSITSPGPTISVDQFDEVTLRLEGTDSPTHNFYVDYNGNRAPNPPAEPVSPDFRSSSGPITYTFTAGVAGTFTYYCAYHQGSMFGTFIVQSGNAPPTATVSLPDGTGDWTGGSVHRIWWNMSDPDDANPALSVFLNYTSGAGSGPIAGPLPGTANPNLFDWTLPAIDAADVVVNLTVIDSGGRKAWDEGSVPVIDSTAPQVVSTVPSSDSTGVPRTATILVTWSEPMNVAATGSSAAFGVRVSPSGAWVTGAITWNAPQDTILTFTPASPLQANTTYAASVNTSARDDSEPGKELAITYTWAFTTGTVTDTLPPQISAVSASPPVQDAGGAVNVSAVVTDDFGVAGVWLQTTSPSGGTTNESMRRGEGSTYYLDRTYAEVGAYTYRIWAVDTSGRWTSVPSTFEIRDVAATPGEPFPLWIVGAVIFAAAGLLAALLLWRRRRSRPPNL